MHSGETVRAVLGLARAGKTNGSIARATGVPVSTVQRWVAGRVPYSMNRPTPAELIDQVPPSSFAHLLGLYLGDGHIAAAARGVFRLCVYMDSSYPFLVAETALSMRAVMPTNAVNVRYRTESRCAVVGCYSKNWPILFPQHGPGRKHDRKIELAEWQRAICKAQPRPLIRGLIHSDGCRVVARVMKRGRRYLYPRYYFANQSEDIKRIFCDYLDQLEIPWTRANRKLIQIAHREGVAALDDFVGPKR